MLELGYSIDYEDEKEDFDPDEADTVELINGERIPWEQVKRCLLYTSKGGCAIDFVRMFYNQSFPDAVTMLLGGEQGVAYRESVNQQLEPKKPFVLPEANQTMHRAFAYLKMCIRDSDAGVGLAQKWYEKALEAFLVREESVKKKEKPYLQYRIGKMYALSLIHIYLCICRGGQPCGDLCWRL